MVEIDTDKYDFRTPEKYAYRSKKGLSEEIIREISKMKEEPEWMLGKRLEGFRHFRERRLPAWGPDLSKLKFDELFYYVKPSESTAEKWDRVPEEIKKTFDKLGIPEAERKFLAGSTAQFECLASDTKIPTNPRGLVPISQIKKGDYVFALNESKKKIEKKKVLEVMNKGKRPIYKVTVAGRIIKATINHPFLALVHTIKPGNRRGRYKKEWRYLSDLKIGDLIAIAKNIPLEGKSHTLKTPKLNNKVNVTNQFGKTHELDIGYLYKKVKLPKKTSEDLLWLFGLFIGDGWVDKSGRTSFAIPDSDPEVRKELTDVVNKLFHFKIVKENKYKMVIRSRIISEYFKVNGFTGSSNNKRLPEWIYALPKNELLAFIGGYLDSDGYVRLDKKCHDAVLTSVNKELLDQVRSLLFYCSLQCSKITTVKQQNPFDKTKMMSFHRLHISGDLNKIKSRNPNRYKRFGQNKYQHNFGCAGNTDFRKHISENLGFAKIKKIEPCGEDEVFDITVKDHHNFVAENIIVHNSEAVYHHLKKQWEDKGIIFTDMDTGLKEHPEIVEKYFGTIVPIDDNKFASLNTATWSGGSFVYVPKGVHCDIPLQAYFRINTEKLGQFERTLIICEEGASVSYIEGCSAPVYSTASLHAAVVEIIAKKNSKVRYTTIQNWSNNVYNLVTKRSVAHENAVVEWLDGNMGSAVTQKYPGVILKGEGARAEFMSVAYAGKNQVQDTGAKAIHLAPNTSSKIIQKSVCQNGGRSSFRGLIEIAKGAENAKSFVECNAYLLDEISRSDTYPTIRNNERGSTVSHEARVGKIGTDKLFYLMSRGISEKDALSMIVLGFMDSFIKELPMEYAVELNRLIQIQLEGAVG